MRLNHPQFVEELVDYINSLEPGVQRLVEVGGRSTELVDALSANGIQADGLVLERVGGHLPPAEGHDLVLNVALLSRVEDVPDPTETLRALARIAGRYVLSYAPNRGCQAYRQAKRFTRAPWRNERDFVYDEFVALHESAGLRVLDSGFAGAEWAKRFGAMPSDPYLVFCLAEPQHVPVPQVQHAPALTRHHKKR